MKKHNATIRLLAVAILIVSAIAVRAQGTSILQRYGLKAGVQRTAISVNSSAANDWNLIIKPGIGFQVGAFAALGLSDRLFVQPELLFSAQSFKEITSPVNMDEDQVLEYKANFLKIPVLLRYGITEKFFAEIGPQVDFLVSANIDKADWDVFAGNGKTNFSAAIGAEYLITDQLGVQVRYAHTLGKRPSDGYIWYGNRPTIVSLGVTYSF